MVEIENEYKTSIINYNKHKQFITKNLKEITLLLPPIQEIVFDYLRYKPVNPVSPQYALPPASPMNVTKSTIIARSIEDRVSSCSCEQRLICCVMTTALCGGCSMWNVISAKKAFPAAANAAYQLQQPIKDVAIALKAASQDAGVQAAQKSIITAENIAIVAMCIPAVTMLFSYGILRCRKIKREKISQALSVRLDTRIANRNKVKNE